MMNAGRELMGAPYRRPTHGACCTCQTCGWPNASVCQCGYPDDIQMAWLVVEQMERNGWFFVMEYDSKDCLDVAFYTESK
ncbi:MAG: hypothetical protein OEV08_07590, partial [Nitrospira sp.]|nr:hypothetical protein [Nitrospira sp.]